MKKSALSGAMIQDRKFISNAIGQLALQHIQLYNKLNDGGYGTKLALHKMYVILRTFTEN